MRVLQLITRRQRRGAEVFAADLADGLARRGHQVLLAGLYAPIGAPLEPRDAEWRDLGASPRRRLDPRTVASVVRLIREVRPDVVQANGSDTLKYSALARALSRGGWTLIYRNISLAGEWLRHPLHRAWNRWLVGCLDHVVSVSRASGEDFLRTYRLAPSRLSVIPRAVRVPAWPATQEGRAALEALTGVPRGAPLLVHVGGFTPEKNHLWLLDAFVRIRERFPDAHLVLLGDGALRAVIADGVARRGLGRWVHLPGSRADAALLVAGADVCLLPSRVEGIPGAVLEAGAQAVPAVATDVGGVGEAILDGETGCLVPPGDTGAFVAATVGLLADPQRRAQLGLRARELVSRRFELEAVVGEYEELYARLRGVSAPAAARRHPERVP